jgi:hypothetical protein
VSEDLKNCRVPVSAPASFPESVRREYPLMQESGSCHDEARDKGTGKGCHSFRRFRSSVLGKSRIEEDLRKFWLGHENNDITAQYAEQIRDDNAWRQEMPASVGLGFKIPAFVPKPIVRKARRNRKALEMAVAG